MGVGGTLGIIGIRKPRLEDESMKRKRLGERSRTMLARGELRHGPKNDETPPDWRGSHGKRI